MSKYEVVTINNKLVSIDLSDLIKKENLFFNATEIAKQYDKDISNFMRLKGTDEYINLLILDESVPCKSRDEIIIIKQGGKYQGTWMHHELAYEFASWCSTAFRYALHKYVKSKLQEEKCRKQERALARLEYPELTDAIQEFLITGKDSDKWLYSNEADLINYIVLGCKSKKYCEINGIDRVQLRDNLNSGQIGLIQQLQKFDTALIQAGLDYSTRKEKLQIRYGQLIAKLLS